MKNYIQAPLPFQGQKRRFIKDLKVVLTNYNPEATYVDLFGGSGLVSHTVKQLYPNATVVYNDFDNYSLRLANVDKTNEVLSIIRELVKGVPKEKKIDPIIKKSILDVIKEFELKGYVDFITVSTSLLFSGNNVSNYKDLEKTTFYNVVKQNDYVVDGYLNGVSSVSLDYNKLYELYKEKTDVVWLVDPPYLSTDCSSYKSNGYWKLKDYLDVIRVLDKKPYIYFTSHKSSIVELCEWIETKMPNANPFAGSYLKTVNVQINSHSSYTDMMYYKY